MTTGLAPRIDTSNGGSMHDSARPDQLHARLAAPSSSGSPIPAGRDGRQIMRLIEQATMALKANLER